MRLVIDFVSSCHNLAIHPPSEERLSSCESFEVDKRRCSIFTGFEELLIGDLGRAQIFIPMIGELPSDSCSG